MTIKEIYKNKKVYVHNLEKDFKELPESWRNVFSSYKDFEDFTFQHLRQERKKGNLRNFIILNKNKDKEETFQ